MEPPTGVDTGSGVGEIGVRVGVAVGGGVEVGVAVGVAGDGGAAVRVGGGTAVGIDGDVGVRVGGGATVRIGVGVVARLGMEVAVAVGVAIGEGGTVAVSSGDGFPGRSISRTQPSKSRVAIIAPTTAAIRARVNERPPSKSIGSRPKRLRSRPRYRGSPKGRLSRKAVWCSGSGSGTLSTVISPP